MHTIDHFESFFSVDGIGFDGIANSLKAGKLDQSAAVPVCNSLSMIKTHVLRFLFLYPPEKERLHVNTQMKCGFD